MERLLTTKTQYEVAELYGLSRSAIQMVCNRYGLEITRTQRIERPRGKDGKYIAFIDAFAKPDPFINGFHKDTERESTGNTGA